MAAAAAKAAYNITVLVEWLLKCEYAPLPNVNVKFSLLLILTPALCIFGLIGNVLNIIIYTKKSMRSTNSALLASLAVCDIGVITTAFLLYSIEVAYDSYENLKLYMAWLFYLKPVFFISHVFQVAAIYMTVAATVERFLATGFTRAAYRLCRPKKVGFTIASVFLWSLCINATKYFEIEIIRKPWCTGWPEYVVKASALARNPTYTQVYTVWLSNLLVIFIPFVLLFVLNVFIIINMQHEHHGDSPNALIRASVDTALPADRKRSRLFRSKRREASIVLIVVVVVFLVCNSPGFVLTLWERINEQYLIRNREVYGAVKDAITLLTIVNSVANFTVYFIFGPEFRRELRKLFGLKRQAQRLRDENIRARRRRSTSVPVIDVGSSVQQEAPTKLLVENGGSIAETRC